MKNSNKVFTLLAADMANTNLIDLQNMVGWDANVTFTDKTPAPSTFVFASGNNFTDAAHGFLTGLKVRVSNSGGGLPTGLAGATDYWVIVVDANTFALASSLAFARAGTAITISGAGTGTQTVTPQPFAGTLVWQKADVNVPYVTETPYKWFTITTPTTAASQAASAATLNYYDIQAMYSGVQALLTVTSGMLQAVVEFNAKG